MKKDLVINVLNLITKCARQRYTKSQLILGKVYTTLRFLLAYALNSLEW